MTEPSSPAILIDGFTPCACTHTYRRHEDLGGVCEAAGCGCLEFRPGAGLAGSVRQPTPATAQPLATSRPAPAASAPRPSAIPVAAARPSAAPPTPPAQPSAVQARPSLLDRAANSKRAATRKMGQRLARLRKDLQDKLDEEDALERAAAERAVRDAELRAQIERLRAELAEAQGRLGTEVYPVVKPQRKPRRAEPPAPCPHCPKVSKTAGGLASHLKAHHPAEWAERLREMHQAAGVGS